LARPHRALGQLAAVLDAAPGVLFQWVPVVGIGNLDGLDCNGLPLSLDPLRAKNGQARTCGGVRWAIRMARKTQLNRRANQRCAW
jgi:hypothetical protein